MGQVTRIPDNNFSTYVNLWRKVGAEIMAGASESEAQVEIGNDHHNAGLSFELKSARLDKVEKQEISVLVTPGYSEKIVYVYQLHQKHSIRKAAEQNANESTETHEDSDNEDSNDAQNVDPHIYVGKIYRRTLVRSRRTHRRKPGQRQTSSANQSNSQSGSHHSHHSHTLWVDQHPRKLIGEVSGTL